MLRGEFLISAFFQRRGGSPRAGAAWPTLAQDEPRNQSSTDKRPEAERTAFADDPLGVLVKRKANVEELTEQALKKHPPNSPDWYRLAFLYSDLRAELNFCLGVLSRIGTIGQSELQLAEIARSTGEVHRACDELLRVIGERSPAEGLRSEDLAAAATYLLKRRSRIEVQLVWQEVPLLRLRDLIGRY